MKVKGDMDTFAFYSKYTSYLSTELNCRPSKFISIYLSIYLSISYLYNWYSSCRRVYPSIYPSIYLGLQQKDVLEVLELTGLNCPSILQKGKAIIDGGFPTHQPLQHMQVESTNPSSICR